MELTNDWIVGFVDGDGCFKIIQTSTKGTKDDVVRKEKRYCFVVSQNQRSVEVLYALKQKFGCGSVNRAGGEMREYRVTGKKDLLQVILPFFEKHPLNTEKWHDFRLVFEELTGRELTPRLSPVVTRDWFVGFSDAESCFYVSMVKNYPRPQFLIGLHLRDKKILEAIQKFLNCGIVYVKKPTKSKNPDKPTKATAMYQVSSMEGFETILQTFTTGTNRVLLKTKKRILFLKFKRIIRLIQNNQHLTPEGIEQILKIRKSGKL
jgi:hypothetical protein